MMKLIVIRHGETTGDVEDRYGGAYDDGLSAEGIRQVEGLVTELEGRGVATIVTSGLLRARQTGQILQERLGGVLRVEDGFNERDQYGELSGMVKAEARRLHPDLVEGFKDRLFTAPGAESYEDFRARVSEAFEVLAGQEGVTAIVWHGGGMRVLFRDILKLGELESIGDCSWVELERVGDGFKVVDSRGIGFGF